jgi:glycosyltransferase involved in cell wall biosynthesis
MMPQPKLSIITACLNAALTIEASIKSVLDQSFNDFEYIIIDGASSDVTLDIIKKFSSVNKIKAISEPDNGIYDAMNKGLKLATGEWIYFLGSDDVFFDRTILERIFSTSYDGAEVVYGNVKYLHAEIFYDGAFNQEKISLKNICHQSIFFRKRLFDKMGLFNLKYKLYADHEFNIRWLGAQIPSVFINETVAVYNERGISGRALDEAFVKDFDKLLIDNNIVSFRSFVYLKKMNEQLINSKTFKIGKIILAPFKWFKHKF